MIEFTLSKTLTSDFDSFTELAAYLDGKTYSEEVRVTCLDSEIYDEENVDFTNLTMNAPGWLHIIGKIENDGSRTTVRTTTFTGTVISEQHCLFYMNGRIEIEGIKFDLTTNYSHTDKISTCIYIDAPTTNWTKIHNCMFMGNGVYYGAGGPGWEEYGTEAIHWAGGPPATDYKYVYNNVIDRMGLYGFQLIGRTEAHFYNNTFTRNHISMVWWSTVNSNHKVWNNIFLADPSYISITAPYTEHIRIFQAVQGAAPTNFGLLNYNLYYCLNRPEGAQKVYYYDDDGTTYETFSALTTAYPAVEVNGSDADPEFTNYPTDLSITEDSPAVDNAGSTTPTADILDTTRDENPDIGAYEYAVEESEPEPEEDEEIIEPTPDYTNSTVNSLSGSLSATIAYANGALDNVNIQMKYNGGPSYWSTDEDYSSTHINALINSGILSEMILSIPHVTQVVFPSVPSSNDINDVVARLYLTITISDQSSIPITVLYQNSSAMVYSDNVTLSNTDKIVVNSLISNMLEYIIDGNVIII